MKATLLLLLMTLTILSGCASPLVIRPLKRHHIKKIKAGDTMGDWTAVTDGFFFSDAYIEKIMRIRVEEGL